MSDPEAALALHDIIVARKGCWHVHPDTLAPLPEGEWECGDYATRLTARGLTIAPIAEAEAGAALARLGDAWEVSRAGDEYEVKIWSKIGHGPTAHEWAPTLPAAIDAATIGREGEDR